jgi:3'-phosphoadenosine 5'-phosphosulfate sulfotransferase (PAPS reductase)/FAD synthetase
MRPRRFVETHGISSLVCCVSGGKDSLVATHFTLSDLEGLSIGKYVVFVDTTVMCPGTRSFVEDVGRLFGWNLTILRPRIDFWTLVGEKGYPMPSLRRRWCCYKLKLQPIMEFVSCLREPRAEVTGLRRSESVRRRNLQELFFLDRSKVWKYAPIVNWTEATVLEYIRKHGLPMPPNYRLGINETCLCGAFSSEKQMTAVKAHFPGFFARFVELERGFRRGGAAFYFRNRPCYARDIARQQTLDGGRDQ